MNLRIIIILAILAILVAAFLFGRAVYNHSMRVKRRLQMGQIFTNITHELLTPLTVISASVDQLREEVPEHNEEYDLMQMNIQRMVYLLQQILETSKSQAGELKLLVAQGDIMQYIHDTALCLKPLMDKKHLTFSIECSPQSMMGWIDTDKLDKIIYNLLSNAAKYTNEGEVSLQAWTSSHYDYIYIKVRDTGSGIPKEKMKNLFQRFYDGEYRQHKTIGTGLGLALTRDLVRLHKGTISCESEEGKGTTPDCPTGHHHRCHIDGVGCECRDGRQCPAGRRCLPYPGCRRQPRTAHADAAHAEEPIPRPDCQKRKRSP